MTDYKKEAALEAAKLIQNNMVVGLGDGSTIAYIVECVKEKVAEGFSLTLLTSSESTKKLLEENGLPVQNTASFSTIDLYLDGCDEFDKSLNALKSGGGIHTKEKLVAAMAKRFVLVGEEKKYVETFSTSIPVVLEVLPDAFVYVESVIQKKYSKVITKLRKNSKDDSAVRTYNDNLLMDVWFEQWPHEEEIASLKGIVGVVEISFFYHLAHGAVVAGPNRVRLIEKNTL